MAHRQAALIFALCSTLAPAIEQVRAQDDGCEPAWSADLFCAAGFDGPIHATAVWVDGSGARLYIGGSFTLAGCREIQRVAVWDGEVMSSLGGLAPGPDDTVHAMCDFDDGSGPALYVGGEFTTAGGITANGIARWDGTTWSALGTGNTAGTNGTVFAMCEFDDGNGPALYVAGDFTTAGGSTANRIAKWNGTQWSALAGPGDNGTSGTVQALCVYDNGTGPALFVAGSFTSAGGLTVNRIAKWDGTAWSALAGSGGTGTSGTAFTLGVFNDGEGPGLYVGGSFVSAGGVSVNRIARWDGTNWSALSGPAGTGTSGGVRTLRVFDDGAGPALFVAGAFATAGGLTANRIARWDGTTWSTLTEPDGATGVGRDDVLTLIDFDDGTGSALYAGGTFRTAGASAAQRFARWNGTTWDSLSTGEHNAPSGAVLAMQHFDHALYVGGDFVSVGDQATNYIARWSNGSWTPLPGADGGVGVSDRVHAFAVEDQGDQQVLYAAGDFLRAGGITVNRIAAWDGSTWSPLTGSRGTGVNNRAVALALYDDGNGTALYAGGLFISAGGIDAGRIAKWDGLEWSTLDGPNGEGVRGGAVRALATFDDGGGPALFAAGAFTTAGGIDASRIARWNGSEWSALQGPSGEGTNNTVWALCVYDDGTGPALYIGGAFTMAGGVSASRIARWDGADFTPLLTPTANGVNWTVRAMHASGPNADLYVGGEFGNAGGVFVNRIARWDGRNWFALGSSGSEPGLNDWVMAIWSGQRGGHTEVYAGGFFTEAAEASSRYIARWGCPFDPCLPDLNGDSTIDAFDVLLFTGWLNDQDPRADINEDGLIDYFDAIAFVAALELGCP